MSPPPHWRGRILERPSIVPVAVVVDTTQHVVTLRYTGTTSFEQWREAMHALLANPAYQPGMCVVADHREADDIPSPEFVRAKVDWLEAHADSFPGCGWAIIARDLADYGMSRMAEMLVERTTVALRAFRDYAEARAWLAGHESIPLPTRVSGAFRAEFRNQLG